MEQRKTNRKLQLMGIWTALLIAVLLALPLSSGAETVKINFEYFPGPDGLLSTDDDIETHPGDPVSDQFQCVGAIFSLVDGAEPRIPKIVNTSSYIYWSPRALYPYSPGADGSQGERNLRDLRIDFTTPVSRVKIYSLDTDEPLWLRAYNSDGEQIASYYQRRSWDRAVETQQVQVDGTDGFISYVIVDFSQTTGYCCGGGPEYYDLLEFDPIGPIDTSACGQEIAVDIKPTSCPNPVNVNQKGVLPAAILGTDELDVTQIDPSSIDLLGVSPLRSDLEDVTAPFEPYTGKTEAEDCNTVQYPDGYGDLTLKFDTQEVIEATEIFLGRELEDGEVLPIELTGKLFEEFGGTPLKGEDVIVIRKKGKNRK